MSLKDILSGENVVANINENMGMLRFYVPEISFLIDFDQKDPDHNLDLWNHTLLALYYSDDEFDVRLALLLHDIGKPFTYSDYNDSLRKYKNSAEKSADMATSILERLGYGKAFVNEVQFLISNHNKRIDNNLIISNMNLANKLFKVQYCNALAHNSSYLEKKKPYLYTVKQKIKREVTRLYY